MMRVERHRAGPSSVLRPGNATTKPGEAIHRFLASILRNYEALEWTVCASPLAKPLASALSSTLRASSGSSAPSHSSPSMCSSPKQWPCKRVIAAGEKLAKVKTQPVAIAITTTTPITHNKNNKAGALYCHLLHLHNQRFHTPSLLVQSAPPHAHRRHVPATVTRQCGVSVCPIFARQQTCKRRRRSLAYYERISGIIREWLKIRDDGVT